jgi:hypothetical protein
MTMFISYSKDTYGNDQSELELNELGFEDFDEFRLDMTRDV